MAKIIKKNYNITIIFGGVHCIINARRIINNNEMDMVCPWGRRKRL